MNSGNYTDHDIYSGKDNINPPAKDVPINGNIVNCIRFKVPGTELQADPEMDPCCTLFQRIREK